MRQSQRWVMLIVAAQLLILAGARPMALEIYLAPIVYQDDSGGEGREKKLPQEDLLKRLGGEAIADGVSLRDVEASVDSLPRSFLEAARLCESQGFPFLLYGYVKRTEYSYYAEVKLLERERKEVSASFISGDDDDHYERLIDDLAGKITSYIRIDLGMGPRKPADQPARNIIVLPVSVGYWTPMGGDWSQAMAGLASAGASIRFIPAKPLFRLWSKPCFLAMGLDAEYALGTSQPGLESSFLHAARIRLPVEAFMDIGAGHRLGLGVGPLLEIDTLVQARQYGSTTTQATIVPGAAFSILYQYALSSSVSLGLANVFDVAFYSRPLFMYSPRLTVDVWLGGGSQELKNE